jgi:UDP-N-acetylglucosamine 2-epimerase (non-hydrolysing)/GDP/UDP-N,N'-diacetylbacillosamine 2-epimerase (hydrolysing)
MSPRKRVVAVFTGNRAEYGLQFPILKAIAAHPGLEYKLIVSGAHLDRNFGRTLSEIRNLPSLPRRRPLRWSRANWWGQARLRCHRAAPTPPCRRFPPSRRRLPAAPACPDQHGLPQDPQLPPEGAGISQHF